MDEHEIALEQAVVAAAIIWVNEQRPEETHEAVVALVDAVNALVEYRGEKMG